jgi:hypothetical protein
MGREYFRDVRRFGSLEEVLALFFPMTESADDDSILGTV